MLKETLKLYLLDAFAFEAHPYCADMDHTTTDQRISDVINAVIENHSDPWGSDAEDFWVEVGQEPGV